jgi:transcriptional regulator with XRE-family HTH domain
LRSGHANELGAFLKARRAELAPRDVGLSEDGTRRRVAGLRRDEVAHLAAISTDYYAGLEQGRINASASVLAALARTLKLNADQRAYLYELAGKQPSHPRSHTPLKARPFMLRVLDQLTDAPAMVASRICDVLAWNQLAAALIMDFSQIPESQRNYVRLLFTHPAMRDLYTDWEGVAKSSVAYLRMEAAHDPDDTRLAALVGELSVRDPQFRQWWAGHHVAIKRRGTRTFRHPIVGEMTLNWDTMTSDADPDQHIIVYTADPGTAPHRALRILASWAAQPNTSVAHPDDWVGQSYRGPAR